MTAYEVMSVPPILLNAGLDAADDLEIRYESTSLQGYDDELNVTIDDEDAGVQLRVADFTHGDDDYDVYAWTVDSSGGLTAWSRVGSTSQSATVSISALSETQDYIFDFVAIGVLSGSQAPSPQTSTAAQQSGGRLIRVKIRKGDIRPIPPVKPVGPANKDRR